MPTSTRPCINCNHEHELQDCPNKVLKLHTSKTWIHVGTVYATILSSNPTAFDLYRCQICNSLGTNNLSPCQLCWLTDDVEELRQALQGR